MKKLLISIFGVLFVFNSSTYALWKEADKPFEIRKNAPGYAAFRSAVLPGWGQVHNEQPTKAWIVFGLSAVAIAGCAYFNDKANDEYNKYLELGLVNSKYYDNYKNNRDISQSFIISAAVVYLYGIADAYFVRRSRNIEGLVFNINYDTSNEELYLVCKYKV
jgi:hypothetical protein